jgi:hypothetical protein
MTMLPVQIQILAAWAAAKEHVAELARRARQDERGELTGNVVLLAALAAAAAAVAVIIIARINSNASRIPG